MRIVELTPQQFENYVVTAANSNPWQTPQYGRVMSKFDYEVRYVGFDEHGILVGAALLLAKNVYIGFKHYYAPRGILTNYEDAKMLYPMFEELKKYLFKQKGLVYTFDPFIIKAHRDRKGNVIVENPEANEIITRLKKCSVEHKGDWLYFEGFQPRFYATIPMPTTPEKVFSNLAKQIRNKLRKSVKFGVEIIQDETTDVDELYKIHGRFTRRPIEYYRELRENFGPNFEVYYARINTATYVKNSKLLYEKAVEHADVLNNIIQNDSYKGRNMRSVLNKKMEMDKVLSSYKEHLIRSTQLLKTHPEGITLGLYIVLKHKTSIYLYEESFLKEFSNLSPVHLLRWKIIEKYCENATYINIGAVTGEFNKTENRFRGINEVRTNFGTMITEYIGEFSQVTNKPIFSLYAADRKNFRI